jgi:ATP-dependent DNA helicase RecQ
LYSGGDYAIWKHFTADMPEEARAIALDKLGHMSGFCNSGVCRHRAILAYFAEEYPKDNCGACDICLGTVAQIDNPLETAQMILSCVLRLQQQFGAGYTAQVLTASRDARVLENRHDELSTYGLLSDHQQRTVLGWIEQLLGQGQLERVGEFNVLAVTKTGWEVVRGETTPRLLEPVTKGGKAKVAKVAKDSWEGVDHDLFDALRKVRSSLATKQGVPAYVVFGDAALRDMARRRPSDADRFLEVKGVGESKQRKYGKTMLTAIKAYCEINELEMDQQTELST